MKETHKISPLLLALEEKLQACNQLIDQLSDEQFQKTIPYQAAPHKTHSSVGQHLRHGLEFMQVLLQSWEAGLVDYDRRERDLKLETDRLYAKEAIESLIQLAKAFASEHLNQPIKAHEAIHVTHDIIPMQSSLGREILFVIAHMEHHFALISAQCDMMGVALPDNFGKAISTLRYERSQQN